MENKIHVFVFSFNRASHLSNCIDSIRRCAPNWGVTIIDDNSTDKKTVRYLEQIKNTIEVLCSRDIAAPDYKTGALYRNMNIALEIAKRRGIKRVLFIQDDMQFVRVLNSIDLDRINNYFESNENVIQLQPCFRSKSSVDDFNKTSELDFSGVARFKLKDYEVGKDNFSAVGLFDVNRTVDRLGEFGENEISNSLAARVAGVRLGFFLFPFMHWTPYPISHRGKKRRALHRLLETLGGAGFHPIHIMADSDAQRLLSRSETFLCPVEEFCSARGIPSDVTWVAGGGEYLMLGRNGLPARVFRTLRTIKRSLLRKRH